MRPKETDPRYHRALELVETATARSTWGEAVDALAEVVAQYPHDPAPRVALAFALDCGSRDREALREYREVLRLDPTNEVVEVLIATLLAESGAEADALAAIDTIADRRQIDLDRLRRDIAGSGLPLDAMTIIANAFVHGRNHLQSWLEEECERVLQGRDPVEVRRRSEAERRACQEMQEELGMSVVLDAVPESLRDALRWASRVGVGDDICRGRIVADLEPRERRDLMNVVQVHGSEINTWLDRFGSEPLPQEASAFMYLLLAVDEIMSAMDL